MNKTSSQRLPPLKRNWWLKHRFFKLYMLREATVLPLVFFLLCLMAGMVALVQGADSWQGWVGFMGSPVVLALNLLALAASLYHAATFFVLFPRVMPLRIAGRSLPDNMIVAGQWAGVVVVALLFFWLLGRA
ncbi:MAG: fumarate reductase subunit C [Halomonadaceae bacterium]|uniref:Fumarate reductase subunit C n=1 Tax=Halomonas colorata TaxID=2742615 RepID=A0ABR9FTX1_9GAMM|nr:fumarate reductase subunit C [Halomonas colorata]MBE0462079.1 fumarate reductase subunit C [Halomonas colorata]